MPNLVTWTDCDGTWREKGRQILKCGALQLIRIILQGLLLFHNCILICMTASSFFKSTEPRIAVRQRWRWHWSEKDLGPHKAHPGSLSRFLFPMAFLAENFCSASFKESVFPFTHVCSPLITNYTAQTFKKPFWGKDKRAKDVGNILSGW